MKKSVMSFFLALVIIFAAMPNAAFATRDDANPPLMESPEETRGASILEEAPPLQEASALEQIRELERVLADEEALTFKDALASAEPEEPPEFLTETVSDQCGDNLTWTMENGVLTISGEGPMYDFEPATAPWWFLEEPITAIIVEEGVTSVGAYAFGFMGALKTVDLPESVTDIRFGAFYDSSLEKITIRGEHVLIGNYCFFRCRELVDFNVTGSVYVIGSYAMTDYVYGASEENMGQMKLTHLTLPGEDIIICSYAFAANILLQEVVFPGTVLQIGDNAFAACSNLDMELPKGLLIIGASAFGLTNIRRMNIPGTVIELGKGAFGMCQALESCIFPDTLSAIPQATFTGCENLKSVTIPAGVEWIGYKAFDGCNALETVRYYGSREQWERIEIRAGNEALQSAELACLSDPSHEIVISYNLESTVVHLTEAAFTDSQYVIFLQQNPFFPYEVQFTYQGESRSEWFEEYTDTVEIGGYTFYLSFVGIPRYLRFRAGGGKEVLARPLEKSFDNSWNIMNDSLLNLVVDLSDRLWCELEDVEMEEIPGNPMVWVAYHETTMEATDKYEKLEGAFHVDCSRATANWQAYYSHTLNVSYNGLLNNSGNYVYRLRFRVPEFGRLASYYYDGLLRFSLTDESRKYVEEDCFYGHSQPKNYTDNSFDVYNLSAGYHFGSQNGFLSMDFNMPEMSGRKDVEVRVYEGSYGSEEEIRENHAADITSQIWRQADLSHSGGYPFSYGSYQTGEHIETAVTGWKEQGFEAIKCAFEVTVVFLRDGEAVEVQPLVITIMPGEDFFNAKRVSYSGYLYAGSDSWREYAAGYVDGFSGGDGATPGEATFYLYDAHRSAKDTYYVGLSNSRPFAPPWKTDGDIVAVEQILREDAYGIRFTEKAALGLLNQEEFKAAEDIKDQLFTDASIPGGGYPVNFSSGSVSFTIQDVGSDELRYLTFYLREYDPEAKIIAYKYTDAYQGDKYFFMRYAFSTIDT